MAKFAEQLPTLLAAGQFLGNTPVADQTGLTGAWDFSFKYNFRARVSRPGTEIVTLFDAPG